MPSVRYDMLTRHARFARRSPRTGATSTNTDTATPELTLPTPEWLAARSRKELIREVASSTPPWTRRERIIWRAIALRPDPPNS